MTFFLYRGNRIERLAAALATVVREPLADPFARECIVVQGPGMERWLSARLSEALSVWANPWFPFPRAIIELALDAALGEVPPEEQVFRPEALALLLARVLPSQLGDPAFADVARYLGDDARGDALCSLASLLAASYDQYLVYRPDMVLGWERGEGDHFQARLWRAVMAEAPRTHIAQRMSEFALALEAGQPLTRGPEPVPTRISLFGISTLPPAFLHVLTLLSERIDVHLFLLSPSPEYWGDFDRKLARGNSVRSLLANLGKVSQDFIELLLEHTPFVEPFPDLFELGAPKNLLQHLQHDIAELRERDPALGGDAGPVVVSEHDDSLRVHVCHSPLRELEVLRDELYARFERDETLEARDVVVFAPDIERYAPAIEAVFAGQDQKGRPGIPFRIADRRAAKASEVLEGFLALLELADSRLLLSEVLDFLHRAPVRARFGIEESELELVQAWLTDAGARWGVDAAHRARFGQPDYEENSFRFALARLLVGYASADGELRSVHGVLPYGDVEGEAAELLGRLARFAETLFGVVDALSVARPLSAWSETLIDALTRMLSDEGELGYEHQSLRATLAALSDDARAAGFDAEVGLKAARLLFEARVDRGRANVGFLSAGVTFCEHVPMRAIPFRLVCMVGMDDESFPRRVPRPSFDLTLDQPRRGDRNVRDDDRQLFLEALLSARDGVIVTYVGRSAKDDSERPPSLLLEQLLRVVDRHFVRAAADRSLLLNFEQASTTKYLTRVHALHRFDPRYFAGRNADFFSYDASAAEAAQALLAERPPARPFVPGPLDPFAPEELDLDDLVRFFRDPQRAFLAERLGVRLPYDADEVPDREPTSIDALERYRLHDRLLRDLAPLAPDERLRVLTQEGKLPPGTTGKVLFAQLEGNVEALRGAVDPGEPLPDRLFSLQLPKLLLTGRLSGLFTRMRVEHTVAQANEKHLLSAWIRHVALCASGEAPRVSALVARAGRGDPCAVYTFTHVEEATTLLTELVDLYLLGMHMPLPYLHAPAAAYLKELAQGKSTAQALERARQALPDKDRAFGGGDDRYLRQVWSDEQLERLGELAAEDGRVRLTFPEVAERVLSPMRQHLAEEDR